MRTVQSRWLLLAAVLALLTACGSHDKSSEKQAANATATPTKALLSSAQLLKSGDLDGLLKQALPPPEYKQMRADWVRSHQHMEKISAEDRKRFAEGMARLTAPNAEQKLWAEVQPKLKKFDQKSKAQLPMMIGVFQIMLGTQINNSKQLTPDQKKQASDMVATLGEWAQKAKWTDPDKARQVIGVLTSTARKLDIKTLKQANALPYDEAMKKYGMVWNCFKQVLDIYGLSIDKTLDSVTAKKLSGDADTAKVQLGYTLLGKPQKLAVDMVKIKGRWYNKHLLEKWRKQQKQVDARMAAAASAVPAASSAAVAKPASTASSVH